MGQHLKQARPAGRAELIWLMVEGGASERAGRGPFGRVRYGQSVEAPLACGMQLSRS